MLCVAVQEDEEDDDELDLDAPLYVDCSGRNQTKQLYCAIVNFPFKSSKLFH